MKRLYLKSLFDKCQLVMNPRSNNKAPKKDKHNFIFSGLLTCKNSGRRVSCDIKKDKYVYLLCRDKNDKLLYISEAKILKQIEAVFSSIKISKELMQAILESLKTSHQAQQNMHKAKDKELAAKARRIEESKSRLLDVYLEQSITQEQYSKKLEELEFKLELARDEALDLHKLDSNFQNTLATLVSIASNAAGIFKSSKSDKKRLLISFVFSNLELDGVKLCFTLRKPFDALVNLDDYLIWLGW